MLGKGRKKINAYLLVFSFCTLRMYEEIHLAVPWAYVPSLITCHHSCHCFSLTQIPAVALGRPSLRLPPSAFPHGVSTVVLRAHQSMVVPAEHSPATAADWRQSPGPRWVRQIPGCIVTSCCPPALHALLFQPLSASRCSSRVRATASSWLCIASLPFSRCQDCQFLHFLRVFTQHSHFQ